MRTVISRTLLLVLALAPAAFAILVTIEAIRTGRFALGGHSIADDIPDDFPATTSFLPGGVLDNAGWVIAACIVWIVAIALLAGLSTLRRTGARRTH